MLARSYQNSSVERGRRIRAGRRADLQRSGAVADYAEPLEMANDRTCRTAMEDDKALELDPKHEKALCSRQRRLQAEDLAGRSYWEHY